MGKNAQSLKAQTIVEYCILFAAVVAVIVSAVTFAIKPALNSLYERTADSIDNITVP